MNDRQMVKRCNMLTVINASTLIMFIRVTRNHNSVLSVAMQHADFIVHVYSTMF